MRVIDHWKYGRNSVLTCFNQKIEVILPPLENYEVKKKTNTSSIFALQDWYLWNWPTTWFDRVGLACSNFQMLLFCFFNVSHGIQIPKACIKIFFGDRSNMSILWANFTIWEMFLESNLFEHPCLYIEMTSWLVVLDILYIFTPICISCFTLI